MPMKIVKLISEWDENEACLVLSKTKEIKLKNKIAKKWLKKGLAITMGDAERLRHDVCEYADFVSDLNLVK